MTTNQSPLAYFILLHSIHSIHSYSITSIPFHFFLTQSKMLKTEFFLFILPLLIASIGEAAPREKANNAPIVTENTADYSGFNVKDDVNEAEGTEFVQEADQEVDQEEIPAKEVQKGENGDMEQMNGIGQKKDGQMMGEGKEEHYGHVHPQPHEAVDGLIPGVKHYKSVEETGNIGERELAETTAENDEHEENRKEDQLDQQEDDEKGQKQEEEEEEERDWNKGNEPKIGQNAHSKMTLGEENEGEDATNANTQNVSKADESNLDGNRGDETEMNGWERENEGEEEEDKKEAKFLRIYPFLKNATADAVSAFHALLRDQHLSKSQVEEKRQEWANEQSDEVKNGFISWKERLEAKRHKKMESIEKKLENKKKKLDDQNNTKDGNKKAILAEKTQQLYLKIKEVIANQAISRHTECKQIRSLVNSTDEELHNYFLEQVNLRLIKFCLDEEEQQIVEDSMPPGPGEDGEQQKNMNEDGLPISDGSDDLEQNHPPPPSQKQTMVNEEGGNFGQQQQSETRNGEDKFVSANSAAKIGTKAGIVGNFEDAGKMGDNFDDKQEEKA